MNHVENIVEFPDEILLLIFEYLLPSDRRVASECCQRFLIIWLDNKFIGDRRLVLNDTTFKDPETILAFVGTQRKYDHIVLSESFDCKGRIEFWTKLCETVTKLELFYTEAWPDKNFWEMFQKLKFLKITDLFFPRYIIELPKNLEVISLNGVNGRALDWLSKEYLRKKSIPISIELQNFAEDALRFINEHRQQIIKLEHGHGLDSEFKSFKSLPLAHLKHLQLYLDTSDDVANLFWNLEEKCSQLQYLDLHLGMRLSHVNLKNCTFLKRLVVFPQLKNELKQLAMFENLEEFRIFPSFHQDCFFMHEPCIYKNVKILYVYYWDKISVCPDCFKNMTKSFPNLENLKLEMNIRNIKALKENVPKLKSLTVKNSSVLPTALSFEDFPNLSELVLGDRYIIDAHNWPLMPHLRKLEFQVIEENLNILEKTPALEHLNLRPIYIREPEALSEMVENVVKHLKRLRYFEIRWNFRLQSENKEILENELKRTVKKHSKYIKDVLISDY